MYQVSNIFTRKEWFCWSI